MCCLNPKNTFMAPIMKSLSWCKILYASRKAVEIGNKQHHMQSFDFIITWWGNRSNGPNPNLKANHAYRGCRVRCRWVCLLRPLCFAQKSLQSTRPEREGWIDRDQLYGFMGRNRKPQIALGKKQFALMIFARCGLAVVSWRMKVIPVSWSIYGKAETDREYELDAYYAVKVAAYQTQSGFQNDPCARDAGAEQNFLEVIANKFISLISNQHNGANGDYRMVILISRIIRLRIDYRARFGQSRKCGWRLRLEITVPDKPATFISATANYRQSRFHRSGMCETTRIRLQEDCLCPFAVIQNAEIK